MLNHCDLFQSTRPCGARRRANVSRASCKMFQSTRPCGARHVLLSIVWSVPSGFNPRARVGRDAQGLRSRPAGASFNPRARVGRDAALSGGAGEGSDVSIHAPVWGATARDSVISVPRGAFQSTRPCGARHRQSAARNPRLSCFNPRARVGRDQRCMSAARKLDEVSIHAPVWGATGLASGALRGDELFQSTRPCGARLVRGWTCTTRLAQFQSTRPCGARPAPTRSR